MTLERQLTVERPMIASGPLLVPLRPPPRTVELTIDGPRCRCPKAATILDAMPHAGEARPRRSATSRRSTR